MKSIAGRDSQTYAERPSFTVRHARTLAGLRSALFSLFLATILVFAVEAVGRHSISDTMDFFADSARPAWITVAVFFLVLLGLDALLGREHKATLLIAPLAVIPAFISQQKQVFLSDPLYPTDFLFGRQIMELMPVLVKDRPWTAVGIVAGLIAAVVVTALLLRYAWRNFPRLTRRERLARLIFALPLLIAFWNVMDYTQFSWIRDRLRVVPMMWDQSANYRHNGFALAFMINLPMANISAPAGYMAEAIDKIPVTPLPAGTTHRSKPDVIVLMSESFWDPTLLPNVTLTPDPMPTIRALQGGTVFSPEFGGMTANVEFEALTGFSNAFLPYGSIPYQQYIRHPIPSLATFFRGEGYAARAIHPFQGWFWNRTAVYKAFGFDTFRDQAKMPAMKKRGMFASDEAFTREIIRQADAMEGPFFFFAVTLQGHGPYEPNRYVKNTIKIEGDLPERDRRVLATYAQGIKEADDSLKMLMDWAKKRDRETIIVLFGDHLPPLHTVYTSTGYMKNVTAERKGTKDEMRAGHETPLVVWSNKTGAQKDIGSISPAFLSYTILKQAGYEHPYYTGFLGDVHEHFRVVDRYMLLRKDGAGVADWQRQRKVPASLRDYRFLQHDMMFGKRYGTERFFQSHAELFGAGM